MNFPPRAITELKQELMEKAEGGASASGDGGGAGESVPGDAAGVAAAQRQRVAELNGRVERMARQLKSSADREVASLAQGHNSIKNKCFLNSL